MTAATTTKVKALFRHPEIGNFFQVQPRLQNPWVGDGYLRRILSRILPLDAEKEVSKDFTRFGERIVNEIEPLSTQCELNQPYLVQFDPWGKRIDDIVTSDAWKKQKVISAEEGIVSIGYERHYGVDSRTIQFAKNFLYSSSSGLYNCPISMTDAAAKTIEALDIKQLKDVFERLTSRDPNKFWTSGQWMTERKGGSDVGSGTETLAFKQENGLYNLHGYKWFSSATDSDMAFTLARIADESTHESIHGSRGLSMFFIKTHRDDGSLNNIQVMKLKNKLGTRQLPTGELLLSGTEAYLSSEVGRGVASIAHMLNITRVYNAVASVAGMRRIIMLARDYAKRRTAFGNMLSEYPLHVGTLADLEIETRGGMVLIFELTRLLGILECGKSANKSEEELLLRLLTPIAKLYEGKKCMSVISEGLESFGGQGYIEDTQLPRHLRDAQVTPIWEGTTNILSLDVLRVLVKTKGEALITLNQVLERRLAEAVQAKPELSQYAQKVKVYLNEVISEAPQVSEVVAREFSFALAEVTIGTLLIEQAAYKGADQSDFTTVKRWIQKMTSLKEKIDNIREMGSNDAKELVFDSYQSS